MIYRYRPEPPPRVVPDIPNPHGYRPPTSGDYESHCIFTPDVPPLSWEEYCREYYETPPSTPMPSRRRSWHRYCEDCREVTIHRRGICRECGAAYREAQTQERP